MIELKKQWRAGTVIRAISPIEFEIDCSCRLCDEYGTIICSTPHGLDLKPGDWVLINTDTPNYDFERIYGTGNYCYFWRQKTDQVIMTTRIQEIERLEKRGDTDCGWYDTLLNAEYPDFYFENPGLSDYVTALRKYRVQILGGKPEIQNCISGLQGVLL